MKQGRSLESRLMYVFLLGKLTGFIFGFVFGHLPGAFMGLLLGHLVDRSVARNSRVSWQTFSSSQTANRRQVFFAATFRVMGHIAKADGRVSEEEIRAARQVMVGMRLNAAQMRQAMDHFNEGKSPDFDLDGELLRMNEACRGQPLLRQFFVHTQFFMALAQGDITGEERAALNRIGAALGLSQWNISQIEAQARMRFGHAGANGRAGPQRTQPLGDAYRALGVSSSAGDQDIKTAYRRLMKENHPDKLVARGLPEAMMERARERTREVNRAYERIKEHRGIR